MDKVIYINCKVCDNSFNEEIEILGYDYRTGTCCPRCGRDIELKVLADSEVKKKFCGIDKDFE